MKTLYLHIGTPKTGTSAIQEFCSDNQEVLKKHGCCYPIFPYRYPRINHNRNAAFLQALIFKDGVRRRDLEKARVSETLSKIVDLFQTYDKVVLSDEGLWRANFERRKSMWKDLQELGQANGFAVKVIVYLRRQDLLIESWWNQALKGARYEQGRSWKEWFETLKDNSRFDYYQVLEFIASTIGRENIIVRRYDRTRFPGGFIQQDFLNCIGLSMTDEYYVRPAEKNTRLSGKTSEIQLILNSLPNMNLDLHKHLGNILKSFSDISGKCYPNRMYSSAEAKEFMKKFEMGNKKIAEEYLHEENADLFDMTFKDVPKWEKNNPYMLDDVIRFVGASSIYLLDKIQDLQKENKELSKKLTQEKQRLTDLKGKLRHPLRTAYRIVRRKIRRILRNNIPFHVCRNITPQI